MVDCTGLENRHTSDGIEGSNPSLSATKSYKTLDFVILLLHFGPTDGARIFQEKGFVFMFSCHGVIDVA